MATVGNNRATRLDLVALTLSPPDMKLSLKDTMLIHLKRMAQIDSKLMLYPETDVKGRLHYHGVITKDEHYVESLKKLEDIGFIKVKTIKEMSGWIKYCKKELKITRNMVGLPKKFKYIDNKYLEHYKVSNMSRSILSYSGFSIDAV